MSFEPNHWLLDGFSRWWVEQRVASTFSKTTAQLHRTELLARAAYALPEIENQTLLHHWQLIADKIGYPSAEALAWSAMQYLAETTGHQLVLDLARSFLTEAVETNSLATVRYLQNPTIKRFERLTGTEYRTFDTAWKKWLIAQSQTADVQRKINALPEITVRVEPSSEVQGAAELSASIEIGEATGDVVHRCLILH